MTTMTQHALKHIRLQLARSKAFPNGSASHGYDLVLPLDKNGHIDLELWRKHREACRVRRFWEDEETTPSGISFTSQGAQNTPNGRSNMAAALPRMTKQAFAWACIPSRPANTYRSRIMAASFTLSW
jgi:hypothetical protein